MKNFRLFVAFTFICSVLSSVTQAVSPPPDGGYPNGNTAEGNSALRDLTTGEFNTAVGLFSLTLNTGGDSNTGVGASALRNNTTGNENTAVGADALRFNITGESNTATGFQALMKNTDGFDNTAVGTNALHDNTDGFGNTAIGNDALSSLNGGEEPGEGNFNTAVGNQALEHATTAEINVAVGDSAGFRVTTGSANTLVGDGAGENVSTGNGNTFVGSSAGFSVSTASNIICIGSAGANVSNACFIGNIFGNGTPAGVPVLISENGRLGTLISSKRFKEDIQPMDKASEDLFSLKPVSFRYKKNIDPAGTPQLGLVAEDVEKVNPGLIVRDKEGKPYTVRYDAVNAMLLNEFLKEHATVQELKTTIAQQQKQIETLAAGLQKVSAQLELDKSAPQTVLNNR